MLPPSEEAYYTRWEHQVRNEEHIFFGVDNELSQMHENHRFYTVKEEIWTNGMIYST